MNFYILIPLAALFINIVLATYTFATGKQRTTTMAYLWYVGCMCLWELADVFMWSGISDDAVNLVHTLVAPFALPVSFYFMNLVYTMLRRKRDLVYFFLAGCVATGVFLMMFTDLYITRDVVRLYWGISPTPGPAYMPFVFIMFVVPVIWAIYLLRRYSRGISRAVLRTQLRLVQWGAGVMLLVAMTLAVVLPFIFGIYGFPRINSSASVIQSVFIFLAIARYKFLSISDRQITDDVLRQIDDGIILFDIDGTVIEMNRRAEEILEVVGAAGAEHNVRDLIGGDYSPMEPYRDREIHIEGSGGPLRVLLTQIPLTRMNVETGRLLVLRDITSRKRAEDALLREFNFKEAIIDSSPAFICVMSTEERVLSMNKSMLQALGYAAEDVQGRDFLAEFITGSEQAGLAAVFERITEGHESVVFESGIIAKDGSALLVEWRGRPVIGMNREMDLFIVVGIDITRRRKMEEELIRARKIESLGALAGGIAHDFNNLLTVILGNLSLALMKGTSPEAAHMLGEAEEAAFRARSLTQQLLVFAKGGSPVMKEGPIKKFLIDAVEFVMHGSRSRCEFRLPDELWYVKADMGQIGQAFRSLILNAMEAMPSGGVITVAADNFDTSTEATCMALEGKYVRIGIKDQGAGISPENLKNIFDPYFSTKPGSQGLGLAIAASIIKKHGGSITVNSEPGEGSLFEIYLPAVDQPAAAPAARGDGPGAGGTRRVLLMDDEDLILSMGSKMLSHLGCEVTCASSGEEAVKLYREALSAARRFDLVIMDLTVPGAMGGGEAVRILGELDRDVRAVVSSGYSNDPVMSHFREYGFCDVLSKPYRVQEIKDLLSRVLS